MPPLMEPVSELNLKLRLSKRATEQLAAQARSSGRDVAAVASDLLEQSINASASRASELPPGGKSRIAAWDAWVSSIREWGASHLPAGSVIDDSRESICRA